MNPSRWKRNSDQAYRDRVCRGSKHEMPRWCKGSAGPGGKYARELDDAEKVRTRPPATTLGHARKLC